MSIISNMARQGRRFQFTSKKHSGAAAVALIMGILSLISLVVCIVLSFLLSGVIPKTMAAAATVSFVMAVIALIVAIKSRKSDDVFMTLPNTALIFGIISAVLWFAVYILGYFS